MKRLIGSLLLVPLLALTAVAQPHSSGSHDSDALLADALSATYPAHRAGSTVLDWEGNVLQKGDNGYTCMPTPPPIAARGATAPMCLDEVWLEWAHAWQNKKPFSTDRVGISYMLAGDGGASNVDPFAAGPTDDNEWIVEGAHLMIIAPDASLLEDIPTDPGYGGPYVMWRGTDYEHVMVPVKAPKSDTVTGLLEDALSAADVAMQEGVSAVDWEGNVLQEGESPYTCMPTPPQFTNGRAPMCFDETWMAWGAAWQNQKPFSAERLGISYMLAGDQGASNIDPFADGPTDDNVWVQEGPHLMLVVPDAGLLSEITRDPSLGGPYVMWDNTDYAHVMVPTGDRP
jgi:hypothetical protein